MYIFHLQSWKGKSCWWEQAESGALTKQFAAAAAAAAFSADNAAVLVYKATAQPRGRPAALAAWAARSGNNAAGRPGKSETVSL